ncbi:DNA polymerase III subunit gamma/tau [Deinococcus sp.]|uniref:DNA polymerase III subunit gamma/tau n=1 Tax=Deinococcus sp. TaxID=47478 RepID=UPI003CC5E210
MSAIYQRARPIRWDQVVGQEHVKDVLKAALEQGRIGHAYLFSGPRGVGKTTTARLIAMTANCTTPGVKPCGECESCLSVRAGSHPDVLEIDAASNNSVDDVRELREKVSLSAMRGGKKIYILDEAHMMSRAAFNALLKTLEEPPSHVIFILATTEPEKIIPTILSRCQHYRFRRLTAQEVAGKLAGIAQQEGMRAEPEALQLIGRLADGAMRDGESLLERMLAAGQDVTRAGVEAALGLPPGEEMRQMAQALVQNDAAGLLQSAATLYRAGYAARTVASGLVTALGEALHAELGLGEGARMEGADVPRLLRLQAALDAQDSRFARGADQGSLELALTHALIAGEGSVGSSAAPAGAVPADVSQRLARLEKELRDLKASGVPAPAVSTQRPAIEGEIPSLDEAARRPPRAATGLAAAGVAVSPPVGGGTWAEVLKLASSQLRAFLKPARMHAQQGYVSLGYDDKGSFHAKQVVSKFDELSRHVAQVFGPVMLEIVGPTPDSSRKMQVGGRATQTEQTQVGAGSPPAPAPQVAPAEATALPLPAEPPAFPEGHAERASSTTTQQPPSPQTPAPQPPSTQPLSTQPPAEIPEFAPAGRPRAASQSQPASQPSSAKPAASSPDDRAPAPLPGPAPAVQAHVSDPPPPPEDAPRASYIAPEPIFQEPDWDDLGLPESSAPQDAPPPAAARELEQPAPQRPPLQSNSAQSRPQPTGKAGPTDLRAHPLFQEATQMWPGRVREAGKLKPRAQEDAAEAAESVAEEG